MSSIVEPGAALLYMKVGTHAKESLADIVRRKRIEIDQEGEAWWGYGGATCYPTSMVQPFARSFAARGKEIHLVMQEMNSQHYAEKVRAKRYSVDGHKWYSVPEKINVLGSRYALIIKNLRAYDAVLDLSMTRVAVGPNEGRPGNLYVQGRADKACLEVVAVGSKTNLDTEIKIGLVAELASPYAVFLSET